MAEVIDVEEDIKHVLPKPWRRGPQPQVLVGQGYRGLSAFAGYRLHAGARGVANKVNEHQNGVDPVYFPQKVEVRDAVGILVEVS